MSNAADIRTTELQAKYGAQALETGMRLQGEFFLSMVHDVDELDEEWTRRWLDHIYGYQYNRHVLDDRTRVLIIIGECVVGGHTSQLANHMRTAMRVGASNDEILEVILQASIYGGMPRCMQALRTYRDLLADLGDDRFTESPYRKDARDA